MIALKSLSPRQARETEVERAHRWVFAVPEKDKWTPQKETPRSTFIRELNPEIECSNEEKTGEL